MIKSKIIFGLLALFLLGGTVIPALGQTDAIADHVVINEIDINPLGDDSKSIAEWVELYNPTSSPIDIGGWSIASTTLLKKTLKISDETIIKPDSYLLFSHQALWFPDVAELVELRDKAGNVIDKTPKITDLKNDHFTWQRIYDGYDTDSDSDWKFEVGTPGKSNGKLPKVVEKTPVAVSLATDKENYVSGDVVSITGTVSERVFIQKPSFQVEQIKINVAGPSGFSKNVILFPDLNLSYKTTLNLNKALGFVDGEYTVTVQYADGGASTKFSLGKQIAEVQEKEPGLLSVMAGNEAYLPGQFVTIKASTTDVKPLEGLKYKVINPEKQTVASGVLYPNVKGEFTGSVFMNTVNPVYGTYRITSEYSTYYAEATFDLVKDLKETKLITLKTDKASYLPGEKVIVSGRLNTSWIASFDIEVLQLGSQVSAKEIRQGSTSNLPTQLQILDVVRLAGDSTFRYEFTIPDSINRLGDYRVTVSKNIGSEQVFFKVTEKTEETASTEPFTLSTDKKFYDVGDKLIAFGNIFNLQTRSTFVTPSVSMTINGPDGKDVMFLSCPANNKKELCTISTKLTLTGVPNVVGDFRSELTLTRTLFKPGEYTIKAIYDQGKYTTTSSFMVNDAVVIGVNDIIVTLDKQVYGLGEKVQLSGKVSEKFPEKSLTITLLKPNGSPERHGVIINNFAFSWSWTIPRSENLAVQVGNERSQASSNFGTYKIQASSSKVQTDVFFRVSPNPDEDFVLDQPFTIKTNKAVYEAGEKLVVSGKTTARPQVTPGLIPERVQILVKSPQGKVIFESSVLPDSGGDFKQTFEMPITVFKDGTYRVTGTYFKLFDDVLFQVTEKTIVSGEKPAEIEEIQTEEKPPQKFFEKENRITESSIPITVSEKTINDQTVQPRSIDGSLLTTKRGDEANVNIQVTTASGTCVIGPDTSCLVSESTRAPGTIYKIVEVDGISYKVRYSGPDARLEKFTIIPESSGATMPDSSWNVEILKSDEPSRFYYKVAYLPAA